MFSISLLFKFVIIRKFFNIMIVTNKYSLDKPQYNFFIDYT